MDRIGKVSETGSGSTSSTLAAPTGLGAATARLGGTHSASGGASGGDHLDLDFGSHGPSLQGVGVHPASQRPFADPNLRLRTSSASEKNDDGNKFNWSVDVLQNKKGEPIYAPPIGDLQHDFHQGSDGNWDYHAKLAPAGGLGHLTSMTMTESGSTDGQPTSQQSQFRTVDNRTGEQQHLSQLISPEDFHGIMGQIQSHQNPDFAHEPDLLHQMADESFAVYHDKDGTNKLAIGIGPNRPRADGAVAEYTFDLPGSFRGH